MPRNTAFQRVAARFVRSNRHRRRVRSRIQRFRYRVPFRVRARRYVSCFYALRQARFVQCEYVRLSVIFQLAFVYRALVIDSVEDLVPARRPRDQVLYLPVPRYFPYRRRQDKEIEIKSVFQRVIVVDRDPARQLYVDSVALVRTERI